MRRLALGVAGAAARWASSAAASGCDGVFLYRADDRLSMQEFSSLAVAREAADGPNDLMLVANVTDWEAPAFRGEWQLLAVVYAAESGCCSRAAGGTLWVRRREAFGTHGGLAFRRVRDGLNLTFRPLEPVAGCAGFTLKLDGKGDLFAQGRRVGQVQSE